MELRTADRIEIVTLVDNYVDLLLESTERITRPARAKGGEIVRDTLVGEHGLSLLVTVWQGEERHRILFDTGYTGIPLLHNAQHLGQDLRDIEALVLSHAHMDHTGALDRFLDFLGRPVPLVVHPSAFLFPRYVERDGERQQFPRTLVRSDLEAREVEVVESKNPVPLAGGLVLVSGEVERRTGFEKGMPNAFFERDGEVLKDDTPDDQSLVMRLKGRGLVIVSGCSHAGIINTILHARKIAGEEKVHAVMGGFHLNGPLYEPIVGRTLDELRKVNPEVLVPMHCTGWATIHRIEDAFPSATVLNSVGSTVRFN